MTHIALERYVMKCKNICKNFFSNFFFEFSNKGLQSLSVELTHDMGTMQKLSTWSSEKMSQKLEKTAF